MDGLSLSGFVFHSIFNFLNLQRNQTVISIYKFETKFGLTHSSLKDIYLVKRHLNHLFNALI